MKDEQFCIDVDGNEVRAGDTVEFYGIIGCTDLIGTGKVWVVGDMNEIQTNMPYIRGEGAWHPNAIRKVKNVQ